jgi:hypothetical protein
MPETDPYARLFKWNLEVPLPGGEVETCLRQLADTGLVQLREREYVLCAHPGDPRPHWVKEIDCPGRYVIDPTAKESNRDCRCDECGGVLYPSRMQKFRSLASRPVHDAIEAFVMRLVAEVDGGFRRVRKGHYVLEAENGLVEVCVADLCRWRDIYQIFYPNASSVVFVVGNEDDLLARLPQGADPFNLADLVFGRTVDPFQRRLRKLVKAAVKGTAARGARPPRPGIGKLVVKKLVPEPDPWEGCKRFPVQRDTEWHQITLFFELGSLGVIMPDGRILYASPEELKMVKGKRNEPTKRWELLYLILDRNGSIDRWRDTQYDDFTVLKNEGSLLRRHLQYVFELYKEPFNFFSRKDGIKTAFRARRDKPEDGPYINQSGWPDR